MSNAFTSTLAAETVTHAWTGQAYASTSVELFRGVVQRTNGATNPSAESASTATYSPNAYGPAGALTTVTTLSHSGTRAFRYTAVGGGNGEGFQFAVAADYHYASVWVYNPSANGVDHLGITSIGTVQTDVVRTSVRDQWVRLTINLGDDWPGGTVIVYNDDVTATAGSVFYWDDVLVGDSGDYFDGATPNVIDFPTVQPEVIDGYSADRVSRHRFVDIVGSEEQDVYVYPAGLRSGSIVAVFSDELDAIQLADWLAGTYPVSFTSSDRPALDMLFLANGRVTLSLDPETREVWLVTVQFQEVTA